MKGKLLRWRKTVGSNFETNCQILLEAFRVDIPNSVGWFSHIFADTWNQVIKKHFYPIFKYFIQIDIFRTKIFNFHLLFSIVPYVHAVQNYVHILQFVKEKFLLLLLQISFSEANSFSLWTDYFWVTAFVSK